MAVGADAPKTETDLLLNLPPTNQPGVFPRRLLTGDERVLFETRPSLLGLYWGRLTIIAIWVLLFAAATAATPSLQTNPAGWFFIGFPVVIAIVYVLIWQKTAYALTSRRVLRLSGLRQTDFADASYDQVEGLTLVSGTSGGIKFDATPPNAPSRVIGGRKYAKTIYWNALPESPRVYTFIQQAFSLHANQAVEKGVRAQLLARLRQGRITCEYCHALVDVQQVNVSSPKCPQCGAPLVAPTA
jgi:hypothetical protein